MDIRTALARQALASPDAPDTGSSGYFAARSAQLDPALFDPANHMHHQVRMQILSTLYNYWARRFLAAREWSTVWLAGSGATGAWAADREAGGAPGDLDILVGVNFPKFLAHNKNYQGESDESLASAINQDLHDNLWPATAKTRIGSSVYELTYYVNAGGTDIRDINPYAAYNVTTNDWTVPPEALPPHFSPDYFNAQQRAVVERDTLDGREILESYHHVRRTLAHEQENTAGWVNVANQLHGIVSRGAALFDLIHDGRREAFTPGGQGYRDFANFRWQAGKASGVVPGTRALKQLDEQAHRRAGVLADATSHTLLLSALANGH